MLSCIKVKVEIYLWKLNVTSSQTPFLCGDLIVPFNI